MSGPVFSPDGKWMWTGSEWIPAPPSSSQSGNINHQDSVVSGEINVEQFSNDFSSSISLKDSVMSGDINIVHNDLKSIEDVFRSLISELKDEISDNKTPTPEHEEKMDTIVELSGKDVKHQLSFSELIEAANLAATFGNLRHSSTLYTRAISVFSRLDVPDSDTTRIKTEIYKIIEMLSETSMAWEGSDQVKSKSYFDEESILRENLVAFELKRIEFLSDFSKHNIQDYDIQIIKHAGKFPRKFDPEIDVLKWIDSSSNGNDFYHFSFPNANDFFTELTKIADLVDVKSENDLRQLESRFTDTFGEEIKSLCNHVLFYLSPYGVAVLKYQHACLLYHYGNKSKSIQIAKEILTIQGLDEKKRQVILFLTYNLLGIIHIESNKRKMKKIGRNYFSKCVEIRPDRNLRPPYMLEKGF